MPRVLFVAGDASGDSHAAHVAQELKSRNPSVEILAFGGSSLEKAADHFLGDLVGKSVMGFFQPIKKLPWFWNFLKNKLVPALEQWKPDVVVPTDFFGFNRFTAAEAKKAGAKVFYFISPQVWASREGRVEIIKKSVDRMLVIFPFEKEFYEKRGVPVSFVGHPLLDVLPQATEDSSPAHVEPIIGLLPGSRVGEVKRHLPLFLRVADKLSQEVAGLRFVLFAAGPLSNDFYDRLLGPQSRRNYLLEIVRDEGYQWRSGLDLALTSSGTATLENALLGIPMAVVYRMSWFNYLIARSLIKVEHISMVNILAKKTLVPEMIQGGATVESLSAYCLEQINRPQERRALRSELLGLRSLLGGEGAGARAAQEIASAWT